MPNHAARGYAVGGNAYQGNDEGVTPSNNPRKENCMQYQPPKTVQIRAELFLDLYQLVSDLAHGRLDEIDAQMDAEQMLPEMIEKVNAMQARYEYWQQRNKTEKEG